MAVSRKTWLMLSATALLVPTAAEAKSPNFAAASASPEATGGAAAEAPAQDSSQTGSSAGSSSDAQTTGIQDIVVTAQQRGENLQKAALAVAVVTGDKLIDNGVRGIDTLGKLVPAFVVASSSQGNLVFIRGVGNFSFTPNSDPATAYNFDGVYIGRSSATVGSFYDLERVEVLKGPQGTLYGRNATAGAINILPVQPKLGDTSGYATASYGNYNAATAEGAVNLGLGKNAGLRLSGSYSDHDGYLRDGTQDEKQFALRGQLKVELTPDITVRIEGDYAQQRGFGSGSTYFGKYAFSAATGLFSYTPSGLPVSEGIFTTAAQAYRTTNGTTSIVGRLADPLRVLPFLDNDVYGIAYHLDWKTSIGTFSVIPAWRHGDKDNLSTDSAQQVGNAQKSDQYSIEARLVSNQGKIIDYNFGAFYFSERLNDRLYNSAGTQATFTNSIYQTNSPAVYGRLTLHATRSLRFTGGIRYTEDRKNFTSASTTLALVCTVPAPMGCPAAPFIAYTTTLGAQPLVPATSGATLPVAPGVAIRRTDVPASGALSTNKVTYRGAAEFDLGEHSLLYASVETGYRAGGFNPTFNYGPETITAYTIGSKNRFFDNRVQLNLELFEWKYRGQQLTYLGVDPFGRIGVLTQNVGRSTIKGAEVEGQVRVTPTTTLNANVQYLDATYDSFTYTTPARPLSGCGVTLTTTFTVDCSGKPAINSPKWTVNLGAEQVIPLGDYRITLRADTQYRSSRYVGFEYIAPEYVDHSWTTNAQVAIGTANGKYVVSAFVRNIEGSRTSTYATPVPASNLIILILTPPRTYGLRLSTRF